MFTVKPKQYTVKSAYKELIRIMKTDSDLIPW